MNDNNQRVVHIYISPNFHTNTPPSYLNPRWFLICYTLGLAGFCHKGVTWGAEEDGDIEMEDAF